MLTAGLLPPTMKNRAASHGHFSYSTSVMTLRVGNDTKMFFLLHVTDI